MSCELIDVQLVGDSGECLVDMLLNGEHETAIVLWSVEYGTVEVVEASSKRAEDFVHGDSWTQELVERAHARFMGRVVPHWLGVRPATSMAN